ncbi:uncharacterized protein LOC110862466 [Folsomia candida]|nr:uncharacterized protein LOC110862466 [Folsomia candida]
MLTMARANKILDDDIFGRLVELGKLRHKTRTLEAEKLFQERKKKGGITLPHNSICLLCNLEFCTGEYCNEFSYDFFARMILGKDYDAYQESKGKRGNVKIKKSGKSRNSKLGEKLRKKRKHNITTKKK